MELRKDAYDVQTNVTQQSVFKIEASSKAFKVLSSSLYVEKELAIVRELFCNAWDAQRAAGTLDTPIEVTLPNGLIPEFSIRDFGTGLSEEQINSVYTSYFTSTKTNNNDDIGGFGLGSKTPFSYTDAFTVSAYFEGECKTYSMFISEDGTPSVAKLGEAPTSEPNGLKVALAVKPEDFGVFEDCLLQVVTFFDEKPTVRGKQLNIPVHSFGSDVINIWERSDKTSFNGLNISDHFSHGIYLVMGNVPYPVQDSYLTALPSYLKSGNHTIFINVPIGSVELAPSREELDYSKKTKVFLSDIVEHLKKVEAEYIDKYFEKVDLLYPEWKTKPFVLKQAMDFIKKEVALHNDSLREVFRKRYGDTITTPLNKNIADYPKFYFRLSRRLRTRELPDGVETEQYHRYYHPTLQDSTAYLTLLVRDCNEYVNLTKSAFDGRSLKDIDISSDCIFIDASENRSRYIKRIEQSQTAREIYVLQSDTGKFLTQEEKKYISDNYLCGAEIISIDDIPAYNNKMVDGSGNNLINTLLPASYYGSKRQAHTDPLFAGNYNDALLLEQLLPKGGFYFVRERKLKRHEFTALSLYKFLYNYGAFDGELIASVNKKEAKLFEEDDNWWELNDYMQEVMKHLVETKLPQNYAEMFVHSAVSTNYYSFLAAADDVVHKKNTVATLRFVLDPKLYYKLHRLNKRITQREQLCKENHALVAQAIELGIASISTEQYTNFARSLRKYRAKVSKLESSLHKTYPLLDFISSFSLNKSLEYYDNPKTPQMLIAAIKGSARYAQ